MPSNKIIKVPVELVPQPRREDGKIYKGNLDREVRLIQPDESPSPTNAIPQREALAAGFVVPDGVYTMLYPDGTSPLMRVQGGKLMDVAAKAAGKQFSPVVESGAMRTRKKPATEEPAIPKHVFIKVVAGEKAGQYATLTPNGDLLIAPKAQAAEFFATEAPRRHKELERRGFKTKVEAV